MVKKKVKPKKKPDPLDTLHVAIAKYLESVGWKPVVVGGIKIQQEVFGAKYNYEFVVRLTAVPPIPTPGAAG